MRTSLFALILLVGCSQAPHAVTRVVVRDSNFQVLRTIDEPTLLAQFTELWRARQEAETGPNDLSEYPFKLDIAASSGSGRWLYRPDGFTTLLSVQSGSVYRIPKARSLNAVLGLGDGPSLSERP